MKRIVLLIQTIYYSTTAVWPLLHMSSFVAVTGPKTDLWLVKTVAVLLVAISISFIVSLKNRDISAPVISLAISSAVFLTAIDIYYSMNDTISDIYLGDAVVEIILILAWIISLKKNKLMNTDNTTMHEREKR